MRIAWGSVLAVVTLCACEDPGVDTDSGVTPDGGATTTDAGTSEDGGQSPTDAGVAGDGGAPTDAGTTSGCALPQPFDVGVTYATTVHVATNGNDGNAGTEAAPLATLDAALNRATPGTRILLHAGTYT